MRLIGFHFWHCFFLYWSIVLLKRAKIWLDATLESIWAMSYVGSRYLVIGSAAPGDTFVLERGRPSALVVVVLVSPFKSLRIIWNFKGLLWTFFNVHACVILGDFCYYCPSKVNDFDVRCKYMQNISLYHDEWKLSLSVPVPKV